MSKVSKAFFTSLSLKYSGQYYIWNDQDGVTPHTHTHTWRDS